MPSEVAMDEMDIRECAAAWQRLMLVGHSPAPALWQGYGEGHPPVRLLEGNLPTDSLRWAAALARLVDEGRASQPFLYPGPPDGEYEIGLALAGSSGKSGWSWKGAAAPNILFDWSDARQRFHAQWTPAGAVLKASRSW